jgi:ribonuclease PH
MEPNYIIYPEGSVLISLGNTRVLCNATVEEVVPRWMKEQGVYGGWVTGEYSLLPRSTHTRTHRENNGIGGRTHEIRRLIGRSLRASIDLKKLGQRTITLDCDVLQADGGTRTAAVTGGYVALALALDKLVGAGAVPAGVFISPVAAVSAGVIDGTALLDLCYEEDSRAEVDVNVVMTAKGEFVEVQGTAEGKPYSPRILDELLQLAWGGIQELMKVQAEVLRSAAGIIRSHPPQG